MQGRFGHAAAKTQRMGLFPHSVANELIVCESLRMPFAGRRESGHGVGGIGPTMHDMTQEKMFVFRSPTALP